MTVERLIAIALAAPDLPSQAGFFRDAWGLTPVAEQQGICYLRGSGAEHHILSLHCRPLRSMLFVDFAVRNRAAVEALYAALRAKSIEVSPPAEVQRPGGGYGFVVQDPDGRKLRVLSDVASHSDIEDQEDRPRKLSHVVFNTPQMEAVCRFYCDFLGFRISDWSADLMVFLRCNQDHHSIALNRAPYASINHVAYEMPSIHAYMRAQGRMKAAGCPVAWGPGRHGPGNNPFAYFVVPGHFVFEYTAELQQIDESGHQPQRWERTPEKSDLWGTAGPPSPAIRAVMAGSPDSYQV